MMISISEQGNVDISAEALDFPNDLQ